MGNLMKTILRPLYYFLFQIKLDICYLFRKDKHVNFKDLPIIINNRDRLTTLILLLDSLRKRGYENLHIIDNVSTYPPLLEYYDKCPYPVYRQTENLGHRALWKSGIYKRFGRGFYVYTDSDLQIVDECPTDFLKVFLDAMKEDRKLVKVGLSLKIDDLPDCFRNKMDVIKWESQFYQQKVSNVFYRANVDTTLALYRPGFNQAANSFLKMYRSAFPYQARHLPWYIDSENIQEEEMYYVQHAKTKTHWTEIT